MAVGVAEEPEPEPEDQTGPAVPVPPGSPRTRVMNALPANWNEDPRLCAGFCMCGRPRRTKGYRTCCGKCGRGCVSPWAETTEGHSQNCERQLCGFWFAYHNAGQVIVDLERGRIARA